MIKSLIVLGMVLQLALILGGCLTAQGNPPIPLDIEEETVKTEESLVVVPVPLPVAPQVPDKSTLRNPSWEELWAFLLMDKTDELEYVYPTFVCHDFATTLQANAKKAGWRCAMVTVWLVGYPDWFDYGIPSRTGHALNAFETTDRGLVYIDCTAVPGIGGNADKIIDVQVGKEYIPQDVFLLSGSWVSMGTVLDVGPLEWR